VNANTAIGGTAGATRVSVIMAAWNADAYLEQAIAQLQAQTFTDFDVVVVDDASDDETPVLLKEWAEADMRVTVLRNDQRTGVARARNRALDNARGEYVWFTDPDDQWSPRILERLVATADAQSADVVVCGALIKRVDGGRPEPIPGAEGAPVRDGADALGRLLRSEIQGHLWNKLMRRSLFDDVRFPPTRAFSDLGGVAGILARARRVALLDEPLYTYLLQPGSILNSRANRAQDLLDVRDVVRVALDTLPTSSDLDRDFRRFEYCSVFVPTINGAIRKDARDPVTRAVIRRIRHEISFRDLAWLVAQGAAPTAAAAAAMKVACPLYAAMYRVFRRAKWGPTTAWAG
jgi:glycosyltransferase involved in cell wall biosynthesis